MHKDTALPMNGQKIQLQYDGVLPLATAPSRESKNWKTKDWPLSNLYGRLSSTIRTNETLIQYVNESDENQGKIKDVGGFVGGRMCNGRRIKENILSRQALTLDVDFAPAAFWDEFTLMYGCSAALYSTHKHTNETPRLRLVIPLDREVLTDEYEAIARYIGGILGIDYFDKSTFQYWRLMYWPSTSIDGQFLFEYQDGPWLSADSILAKYHDWRDMSAWPTADLVKNRPARPSKKLADPLLKDGLIGAFCRAYDIHQAIETFLPDVYAPTDDPNRYTYSEGSTAGGLVIYEDKFAYSHHGTDPASEQELNAFDLIRVHKFGHLEKSASTAAMVEFAGKDPGVKAQVLNSGYFSEAVYANLPPDLQGIVSLLEDNRKRDVTLIGLITALSAGFTRYRFHHGSGNDVKEYSPHILSLVVGAAGSGKGLTRYGVNLVDMITRTANDRRKRAAESYKNAKGEFEREKKRREKNKQSCEGLIEPQKPAKHFFSISASDTTQAALVEILHENPLGCFAFDSEVDTMVQGNSKKDFGGFSDVIRKVFHHEPLARQRKGDGESYTVDSPRLAVMLSGTHDQLKKLIPSDQNGLFSRFWYYVIPKAFIPYKSPFPGADVVAQKCAALQHKIFTTADYWDENLGPRPEFVNMVFTPEQESELCNYMGDMESVVNKWGGDISAAWLRMALIVKRIAVTLAGVQDAPAGNVPQNCWNAAIGLLPALKEHTLSALEIVRQNNGRLLLSEDEYQNAKLDGKTDEEIAADFSVSLATLKRRKNVWVDSKK